MTFAEAELGSSSTRAWPRPIIGALALHYASSQPTIYRAKMLVQIYAISSPDEARALGEIGVDHIGVLVGDGSFPRERSVAHHRQTAMPIFELLYRRCVSRSVEAL